MIDLSADIVYRGFKLNDSQISVSGGGAVGTGISGSIVEGADLSEVEVVQFMEPRALADGYDAGPVFLGRRTVILTGTLYGTTRALLFDALQRLRAAVSPTLAHADEPADKGFQPLYFSRLTNDVTNWPAGAIDMRILVRPTRLRVRVVRDAAGGTELQPLAIPWEAAFLARDPRIMAETPQDISFPATTTDQLFTGNLVNRGDYPTTLNALFVVTGAAGTITITAGGSKMRITVPASTNTRTIRYKGDDRILTVEENNVEALSMSWLTFLSSTTHPKIQPGTSAYSVDCVGVRLNTGSHMWFWEAFA